MLVITHIFEPKAGISGLLQGMDYPHPPSPATAPIPFAHSPHCVRRSLAGSTSLREREPERTFEPNVRNLVAIEMWVGTSLLGSGLAVLRIPGWGPSNAAVPSTRVALVELGRPGLTLFDPSGIGCVDASVTPGVRPWLAKLATTSTRG